MWIPNYYKDCSFEARTPSRISPQAAEVLSPPLRPVMKPGAAAERAIYDFLMLSAFALDLTTWVPAGPYYGGLAVSFAPTITSVQCVYTNCVRTKTANYSSRAKSHAFSPTIREGVAVYWNVYTTNTFTSVIIHDIIIGNVCWLFLGAYQIV